MKFTLAAALLGHTIPALSQQHAPLVAQDGAPLMRIKKILEDAPHRSILEHDHERRGLRNNKRRMMHKVRSTLENTPSRGLKTMVPCDPRSTDADIGILSCGQDYTCEPSITSSLGGVCTPLQSANHPAHLEPIFPRKRGPLANHLPLVPSTRGGNAVQCDPTSIDVGILDCGEGQICQHDETSRLGGFCVDTTTSDNRRLAPYYLGGYLYLCTQPEDSYGFSCDCSGLNNATGDGTITCSQGNTTSYLPGCESYAVDYSYTFAFDDSIFTNFSRCLSTTEPFTESICFIYDIDEPELVCNTEWNGQPCTSCTLSYESYYFYTIFDCTNVDGGRAGNRTKDYLSVFDLCYTDTRCSSVCGDGSFLPGYTYDSNSYADNNNTCDGLAFLVEYLPESFVYTYCSYLADIAQSEGCCVPLNSTIPPAEDENSTSSLTRSGGGSARSRFRASWHRGVGK